MISDARELTSGASIVRGCGRSTCHWRTTRPGRVVREWEVDIPPPRTIESPGVSALAAEITRELHQEISRHGQ